MSSGGFPRARHRADAQPLVPLLVGPMTVSRDSANKRSPHSSTPSSLHPHSVSDGTDNGESTAGVLEGARDLIIAATTAATRRTIVATDHSAGLDDLAGVECVVLQ